MKYALLLMVALTSATAWADHRGRIVYEKGGSIWTVTFDEEGQITGGAQQGGERDRYVTGGFIDLQGGHMAVEVYAPQAEGCRKHKTQTFEILDEHWLRFTGMFMCNRFERANDMLRILELEGGSVIINPIGDAPNGL